MKLSRYIPPPNIYTLFDYLISNNARKVYYKAAKVLDFNSLL